MVYKIFESKLGFAIFIMNFVWADQRVIVCNIHYVHRTGWPFTVLYIGTPMQYYTGTYFYDFLYCSLAM